MKTTMHTNEEATRMVNELNAGSEWDVVLSCDYEYFKLMRNGDPVVSDSANDDLYDYDTAKYIFECYIQEH